MRYFNVGKRSYSYSPYWRETLNSVLGDSWKNPFSSRRKRRGAPKKNEAGKSECKWRNANRPTRKRGGGNREKIICSEYFKLGAKEKRRRRNIRGRERWVLDSEDHFGETKK